MLKRKMLFILFSITLLSSGVVFAQTAKTITNADLEKYRQERLQAEKELRENYAELGFLSPEEQAEQDRLDAEERSELSQRLRQERLEREEIALQAQIEANNAAQDQIVYVDGGTNYSQRYYQPYFYGYPYLINGRFNHRRFKRFKRGNKWFLQLRGTYRGGNFYPPIRIYPSERGINRLDRRRHGNFKGNRLPVRTRRQR